MEMGRPRLVSGLLQGSHVGGNYTTKLLLCNEQMQSCRGKVIMSGFSKVEMSC